MTKAGRYNPTNSRLFYTILKWTYGTWLRRAYNIVVEGQETVDALSPPFVLVGNHTNILDPFILNSVVGHPVYWVTSDGNMRTPVLRFLLLKLVGSIPKSKAIPDIETVNWIVEVIRKRKGVVGLFPEGQATWDGRTIPSFPSTAKLLKILKAPVLLGKISGGYLSLPRWTSHRRRGLMTLGFSVLFTPADLAAMSVADIRARLEAGLAHDETAWERTAMVRFPNPHRAERLEQALFLCPGCGSTGTMSSDHDRFFCAACGFSTTLDEYGGFGPMPDPPGFRTIPEWEDWQRTTFETRIRAAGVQAGPPPLPVAPDVTAKDAPLLEEGDVGLSRGWRMERMADLGRGTMLLYPDRLEFSAPGRGTLAFPVADIEGPGVLKHNFFEFYVRNVAYRATFRDDTRSARPWMLATALLSERAGGQAGGG